MNELNETDFKQFPEENDMIDFGVCPECGSKKIDVSYQHEENSGYIFKEYVCLGCGYTATE